MPIYNNDAVRKQYSVLKDLLEEAVQNLGRNQLDEAAKQGEDAVDVLEKILEQIGKDYPQAFFANKLPFLWHYKEAKKNRGSRPETAEVTRLLVSLDKAASYLGCEIRRVYSKPTDLRRILWVLPAIAAILIFIGIWNSSSQKKQGLSGQYYRARNLNGSSQKRIDAKIDFDWGRGSPFKSFGKKDNFSIRWTGYLRVPKTGLYKISTVSDDGVRLTVGTATVINNWTGHPPTINTAAIELKEGYYPLKLEYFEKSHGAVIRLLWRWPDWAKPKIIGKEYLVPSDRRLKKNVPMNREKIVFTEIKSH